MYGARSLLSAFLGALSYKRRDITEIVTFGDIPRRLSFCSTSDSEQFLVYSTVSKIINFLGRRLMLSGSYNRFSPP